MKLFKNESFWVGVIYFLILLCIALWVRDIPNELDAFSLTLQQLIITTQMGDPGYFATAAIDIAENGWISSNNQWILNLWPPGFILLEALIIKVLGPEVPAILVLQILAAALFSFVLVLLYDLLHASMNSKVAFALPLLIFAFPVSRVFLLQPTGITLGESFSIGFFLLFILLAIRSVGRNSLQNAIYAGLCLALSVYFRSQFEIILLALTVWGVLFVIAIKLTPLQKFIEQGNVKSVVKTVAIALFVAHAATFPWRAYHWVYQESPNWVFTSSVTFGNSVMSTEQLEAKNGGFVVAGGGNLVCRIDPATCGDTVNAKKLFIKTFIEHPIEWYSLKFDVIGKYWFSSVENWTAISIDHTFFDIVVNGLLLIILIAIIVLLLIHKARSHKSWALLMWINLSLFSTYFLIITVQQFESRYFYFPKIAGVVMILIVSSLFFRRKEKNDVGNDQSKNSFR